MSALHLAILMPFIFAFFVPIFYKSLRKIIQAGSYCSFQSSYSIYFYSIYTYSFTREGNNSKFAMDSFIKCRFYC